MSNPRRGEVELELGGTPYTLVFDWNAISDIEAEFGDRSIDQIFFSGAISRRAIREAVRVGLLRKYRKMTPKEVGKLLSEAIDADEKAYNRILLAVLRGLMSATGATKETIARVDQAVSEESGEGDGVVPQARAESDDDGGSKKEPRPMEALATGGG